MNTSHSILFYGASWCGDCTRAQYYFDTHQIPYTYINTDEDHEAALKVEQLNSGFRSIPTIIFPNGVVLVEPTTPELVKAVKENQM